MTLQDQQTKRLGFARMLRDWRGLMALTSSTKTFTQEDAAEYLGFHLVTYRRWENARISIKWYNYEKVVEKISATMPEED